MNSLNQTSKINFSAQENQKLPVQSQISNSPDLRLHEKIQIEQPAQSQNWKDRIIDHINKVEAQLDEELPDLPIQQKIDELGRAIEKQFAPLNEFNAWLNDNGQGSWIDQLAISLAKLPLKAARNIIRLLYNIVKGALYAVVHPIKAITHLAKLIVTLIHELSKPENWAKMGIGMIGASGGQALILGNPVSVIGMIIGASLVIGGLSVSSIKAAVKAEEGAKLEAVKQTLLSQIKDLPESAATGFLTGLLIGGIQKMAKKAYRVQNLNQAKAYADQFVKEHNLPNYSKVELLPNGKISIQWDNYSALEYFADKYPEIVAQYPDVDYGDYVKAVEISLHPTSPEFVLHIRAYDGWERYDVLSKTSLKSVGFTGSTYPTAPGAALLDKYNSLTPIFEPHNREAL